MVQARSERPTRQNKGACAVVAWVAVSQRERDEGGLRRQGAWWWRLVGLAWIGSRERRIL